MIPRYPTARSAFAAALALACASLAARAQCLTSTATWQSVSILPQDAPFAAAFDAVPQADRMDGVTGLSAAEPSGYASLAAIVRFNNTGFIDVRDGGAYSAASPVPYTAGSKYHFRFEVTPATHAYSVYVTPPGSPEITLARAFSFRAEQASVSSLDHWTLRADSGSHQVCGFVLSAAAAAPPG